jgi:hypothetical protein
MCACMCGMCVHMFLCMHVYLYFHMYMHVFLCVYMVTVYTFVFMHVCGM